MSCELSVVVPVYNEEQNVPELYSRLTAVLSATVASYEIVMVDDGSRDRSWEIVRQLRESDSRVKGVRFSRNFGHQMAFTAGLDHISGEAVVIMDADLQDPPELIPELVAKWRDGNDVVYAVRAKRQGETFFKLASAAAFYRVLSRMTRVSIPVDTGDFRLMSRKAVEAFRRLPERHRFTRGLVAWLGYRQIGVRYIRAPRLAGETKYPLRKMLRLAGDAITSFSYVPLRLASWLGSAIVAISMVAGAVVLVSRLQGAGGTGWKLAAAGLAFLSGVQLLGLGAMGEYVGRIHDEAKQRPLYLVDELLGLTAPEPSTARPH